MTDPVPFLRGCDDPMMQAAADALEAAQAAQKRWEKWYKSEHATSMECFDKLKATQEKLKTAERDNSNAAFERAAMLVETYTPPAGEPYLGLRSIAAAIRALKPSDAK